MREDFIRPQPSDDASKATPQKVKKKKHDKHGDQIQPKCAQNKLSQYSILLHFVQQVSIPTIPVRKR